jgi:tetratricopeptide (TPR) repeat protein
MPFNSSGLGRIRTFAFYFAAAAFLAGCPKDTGSTGAATEIKGPVTDAESLAKPEVNFQNGLFFLQPDKKTGAIDYAGAMNSFVAAGNLGGGAKAWFNAGWAAEQSAKPAEAEQYYHKAYDAEPTNEKYVYSLARLLQENGKGSEAAAVFKAWAEAHPDNAEARTDYIQALVAGKEYAAAQQEATNVLLRDPKNAATYRNLSALYFAQGNYSMSQLTGEKSLQLNDADPGTYNNMGVTYLLQGNEPAAIEKFKTAITLDAKNYEANMNLGWIALSSGDYALAMKCFQAATSANPGSVDAKLGLAVATRGTQDYKGADQLYKEIIAADPMNQAAYFNAATLHSRYTKDFQTALDYLEKYKSSRAGQISPSDPVFAQIDAVAKEKAKEDAKIAAQKAAEAAEKARQERNAQLLKDMGAQIADLQTKITTKAECLDPSSVEEVGMVIDQAKLVVEAQDTDMAADMKQMLDAYTAGVDTALEGCTATAAPAPAPDAPAPDAPAPDAPAPGAAPETPAPAPETPAPAPQ